MTKTTKSRPAFGATFVSGLWGNKFEDAMNELYSAGNIKRTAQTIIQLEEQHGRFAVGKFNRYLLPHDFDWPAKDGPDAFEKDFMEIPDVLRNRLSEVIRANIHSADPLPIFYRTSENVDQSHDIIVRPFVYQDRVYLGVLYLCPNHKKPT